MKDNCTIHIVADSLCQECGARQYPQQGWGYYLKDNFIDNISVRNMAQGGWSAKGMYYTSVTETGDIKNRYDPENSYWQDILREVAPGDYVIISHAINDKLRRDITSYYPDTNGNYIYDDKTASYVPVKKGTGTHCYFTWEAALDEYQDILKSYIHDTRAKGAMPILMAPTGKITKIDGDNFNLTTQIEEYIDAMKETAREESVILIDVYGIFTEIQKLIGYDVAVNAFGRTPKVYGRYAKFGCYPEGSDLAFTDEVHYNFFTAMFVADLFCDLLRLTDCDLKEYLK